MFKASSPTQSLCRASTTCRAAASRSARPTHAIICESGHSSVCNRRLDQRCLHMSCAWRLDEKADKSRFEQSRSRSAGRGTSASEATSSRTAFEQRTILDQLRSAQSASGSSNGNTSQIQGKSVPIGRISPSSRFTDPRAASDHSAAASATSALPGGGLGLGAMRNPLGMGTSAETGTWDRLAGGEKEWSELKGREKVFRASLNTSRLTIVLIGGTLTLAVFWSVSTELFASNSPTVIFEDACKRINRSDEIRQHLLPPLKFHSRGTAAASSADDAATTLHFRISSKARGESLTMFERARQATSDAAMKTGQAALQALEDLAQWANLDAQDQAQGSRAHYPVTSNGTAPGESWSVPNWLAAPFRALSSGFGSASLRGNGGPGTYTSADVWAKLEKDAHGTLQYVQLYADIPSSGVGARHRVWIIKRKGDVVR
ncbi:hypothetical protein IE81DRAFT_344148 [Ceraceosorus guamensis]|uniref:Mitochondrial import inner membrane translocase subunit Tim21 n=1 Tax=Ceraceosorus guamensis TaxID=1522189 RepID=A0A316WE78_9BASI|nr:hypothetical protein IE81DRAFT_344148 [Ceraceosorus guamensis]PWN46083.1 hypothetical protein IE81DRAFT_344148 [Ceraceosorus guamensis]